MAILNRVSLHSCLSTSGAAIVYLSSHMAHFVRELVSLRENTMELLNGLVCSREELGMLIWVGCTCQSCLYCTFVHVCTISMINIYIYIYVLTDVELLRSHKYNSNAVLMLMSWFLDIWKAVTMFKTNHLASKFATYGASSVILGATWTPTKSVHCSIWISLRSLHSVSIDWAFDPVSSSWFYLLV